MREVDDELDFDHQQGDYNLIQTPNMMGLDKPNQTMPLASSSHSSQQQQVTLAPRRNVIQGPGFQVQPQQIHYEDQQPQQQQQNLNGSFTITSSRTPSYFNQNQEQPPLPQALPGPKLSNSQLEPIEQSESNSFDQLEGYYTVGYFIKEFFLYYTT